jgi:hypothetical protein
MPDAAGRRNKRLGRTTVAFWERLLAARTYNPSLLQEIGPILRLSPFPTCNVAVGQQFPSGEDTEKQ